MQLALEAWSVNHWSAREVPAIGNSYEKQPGPVLHYFLILNTCRVMGLYKNYCLPNTCDENKNLRMFGCRDTALARIFSNRSVRSCYFFFHPSSSLDPHPPLHPHPTPCPPRGQMYFLLACLPSTQIRSEIAVVKKISEPSSAGQSQPVGHNRYDHISSSQSPGRRVSLPGQIGNLPDSKPQAFNHQTEFFIHSSILNSPLK